MMMDPFKIFLRLLPVSFEQDLGPPTRGSKQPAGIHTTLHRRQRTLTTIQFHTSPHHNCLQFWMLRKEEKISMLRFPAIKTSTVEDPGEIGLS